MADTPAPKPFLVTTGAHTLSTLLPELAKDYDLVITNQQTAEAIAGAGVPVVALQSAMDADVRERANTRAAELTARAVAAVPVVTARMAETLPAGEHPPALNSRFPDWWAGYLMGNFGWQALFIGALDRVAAERRVAGVLVHEDVGPDTRTLVAWARTRGIPTIHLPHAACHLLPGIPDIHRETRAEYVLASGDYERGFYADAGVAPEKIVTVGVPAWDDLYTAALPERSESRQVLGVPADAFVLLYGTTWGQVTSLRSEFENEFHATEDAVFALARERGAYIIVNLHPNEAQTNVQYYVNRLQAAGVRGLVTPHHELYCVQASDVIVKHGPSNFCVRTAIMGVPSCYIQTEGFDFQHPLPPRGPAADLPRLVDEALTISGDAWRDFVTVYNAAHPDGNATERAVEAVRNLCR